MPFDVAVSHNTTPFVTAYPWTSGAGFGTKYSNPATLPAGTGRAIRYSPDSTTLVVAHDTTPFITAYPWTVGSGFGTKHTNPGTLPPGNGRSLCWNSSGSHIALGHDLARFVLAYEWSAGFGARLRPGTSDDPDDTGLGVDFSHAGDEIAIAFGNTPSVSVNVWEPGFGNRYDDPATTFASGNFGVAFAPDDQAILVANLASSGGNGLKAYEWTPGVGFGTVYSDPSSDVELCDEVAFSADGVAVAGTSGNSPFVDAYPWDSGSGFGVKYSDPSTLPAGNCNGVSFAFGDIVLAHNTTPFITAYPWNSSTGFGVKYSDPATLPASTATGAHFTSQGPPPLSAESGTFAITGTAANFTVLVATLAADSGTLSISGTDASFSIIVATLAADSGVYTISGTDATFTIEEPASTTEYLSMIHGIHIAGV